MKKITTKKVVAVAVAATLAFGSLASAMVGRSDNHGELLVDLETGLKGYYTFDDTLANSASDSNGTAKLHGGAGDTWNSPTTGKATYVAGKNGKAYSFAGDTGNITNADNNKKENSGEGLELDVKSGENFTFSAWVNTEEKNNYQSIMFLVKDFDNFVNVGTNFNNFASGALAKIKKTGADAAIDTWLDKNASNCAATVKDIPANTWTYVTFTAKKDGTVALYYNAELLGEKQISTYEDEYNNLPMYLGINFWDSSFKGLMDDVAVYDKALTAEQVAALYENNGIPENKYADPTPKPGETAKPGDEDPSTKPQDPSSKPEDPSDKPTVSPSADPSDTPADGDVISSAAWWSFTGISKDFAVNGDSSTAANVEVQKAAADGNVAFNAEVYNPGTDAADDGYYLTTGSLKDAWNAELSKDVGAIEIEKGAAAAPEVGHTYNITVVRKGDSITVQYYDVTAKALYAKFTWTGGNMPQEANLHIIAQLGTFKVTPAEAMEIIDTTTAKPSDDSTAKPSDNNTAKPSDNNTAKPSDSGKPGVTGVTGKVTKVAVKAAGKKAGKTIYVKKGDKVTLKATVTGTGTYTKGVTYKSSKTKVATVSSKGVIKAKKAGTAKITVTSKFDKTKKATITVKVSKKKVANKKLKLKVTKKTLKKGKTYTVAIKSMTNKTTDKVTYKTSKKKVATVDKYGVVKAKKKGKATITVKCGKKKATLKVTVK